MDTKNFRVAFVSLTASATLGLIALSVVPSNSETRSATKQTLSFARDGFARRQQNGRAGLDEIKRHFPKVDYDAPEPSDPVERAKRRKKGKHYDNGYVSRQPTNHSSSLVSEWDRNLSEFPVQESNAVVIGKILGGGAFISPDKTGVYTELSLKIEEVIAKDRDSLIKDRTIAISRIGGLVRYGTGEESLFFIAGQNMPTVGKRYLFFLKAIPDSEDFQVITGYDVSMSHVIALDDPMQFRKHDGQDITAFIQSVRSAAQPNKK